MKMIYPLRSSSSKRRRSITPVIVVVLLVVIIVSFHFLLPRFLPQTLHIAGVPLWSSKNVFSSKAGMFFDFFSSRKNIVSENKKLREELGGTEVKLSTLDAVLHENIKLKEMLGRKTSSQTVLASILVKPPQSFYDTFILDAGEGENIKAGDKVMADDNVLIGSIVEVYAHSSKARLFSTVGEETQAIINRNNTSAVTLGKGAGNFEIRLPQEIDVIVGDVIVIPTTDIEILGRVFEIETTAADSFKKILVKSPINISEMKWVSIKLSP